MCQDLLQAFPQPLTFYPPASSAAIASVESDLGAVFPPELSSLLAETDGVKDEYDCWLLWPVERIRAENLAFRTEEHFQQLYMPFDHLLFFAADGFGNCYAFPLRGARLSHVFFWDHEDDSRTCLADSLRGFVGRLSSAAARVLPIPEV